MNLPAPVYSMAYEPRKLKATEERLSQIYEAAKRGLTGDSLALSAGMTPAEYRRLCEFDGAAEIAALKGRADAEAELSGVIYQAAVNGDSKAALEMLKHRHDWVAKQQVSVEIDQRISITDALREANGRIIDAGFEIISTNANPVPSAATYMPRATQSSSASSLQSIASLRSVNQSL